MNDRFPFHYLPWGWDLSAQRKWQTLPKVYNFMPYRLDYWGGTERKLLLFLVSAIQLLGVFVLVYTDISTSFGA